MKPVEISHVSFAYENGKGVLDDISFFLEEGEATGIIGANGTGKSTLLKVMSGLKLNFDGEVKIQGIQLSKTTLAEVRSHLGFVFQDSDSQLFMNTVYEDVAFGPRNYGMKEEDVRKAVSEALNKTGISSLAERHITQLSGGEKKLVSIAGVLSMGSDILLLDEPSIMLDPWNRRNLIHLLNGFQKTKLIASHDLDLILDTCARTIVLHDGKIVADGKTEEILRNRSVLEENHLELPLCMQNY